MITPFNHLHVRAREVGFFTAFKKPYRQVVFEFEGTYFNAYGHVLPPEDRKRVVEAEELASQYRYAPGQTPYTPTEVDRLHRLVGQAADGDPGEENENRA